MVNKCLKDYIDYANDPENFALKDFLNQDNNNGLLFDYYDFIDSQQIREYYIMVTLEALKKLWNEKEAQLDEYLHRLFNLENKEEATYRFRANLTRIVASDRGQVLYWVINDENFSKALEIDEAAYKKSVDMKCTDDPHYLPQFAISNTMCNVFEDRFQIVGAFGMDFEELDKFIMSKIKDE